MNFETLKDNYSGKKVFVTGHTGFKGGWLTKILSMAGARVKGYALAPNTQPNFYTALGIEDICQSVFGDIMDASKLNDEINTFEPDYIFHLAAQPLVRTSYQNPADTFAINAIGTAHVLDAVRNLHHACTVVLITTDKVYYNNEWDYPYRECDRLGGYDPYSASKACAELVIDSYRNCYFHADKTHEHQKRILVARAGNVIGGGDWSTDRLIPDIVKAFGSGQKVILRNPASVRPWQHVLEPLAGYLMLATKGQETPGTNAYNFGPHTEDTLTVEQIVQMTIGILGEGDYEVQTNANDVHEAKLLKLDISLATNQLRWNPKLKATDALKWTMDWYNTYRKNEKQIGKCTTDQILAYFNQ